MNEVSCAIRALDFLAFLKAFSEASHPRDACGRFSFGAKKVFKALTDILATGASYTTSHSQVGKIWLETGCTGKSGYGLRHIIEQRFVKDGRSVQEIASLLSLIVDVANTGVVKYNGENKAVIEKGGIRAVIARYGSGKHPNWILTGYDIFEKREGATDAIEGVIHNYSYAQEFSDLIAQVVAVVSSIPKGVRKSRAFRIKSKWE